MMRLKFSLIFTHSRISIERIFVATLENWDTMADRLSGEAERWNWRGAKEVVMIGDGGADVKGVWQTAFPTIPFILDWAHAMEHLHKHAYPGSPFVSEDDHEPKKLRRLAVVLYSHSTPARRGYP